ncbi:molybdopterin synthase subunit MoaE [Roseiarcus fermentans]|uniref:Molybdopterin synthase catalytic subunit n=1 Tax=Roseiarcus fermentans TaxID=1473586 RepID=A0A366EKQ0_9HYPH|nr:molybdenum cofactor biosynthesis protein MoaE [Roseiarcus fermentans]RBP02536.1 molybdopterin synthase subunit MoaE [Roseiarcus fermentans]
MATVRVQREDFDAGAEAAALARGRADVGAVVSFVGFCRDDGGRLAALELEHYPGMAEAEMARAAAEAEARWPLLGVTAIHRFGRIAPGEQIVLVAVASAHRGEAFAAAEMLMDFLKTRAPFWKRALMRDGTVGGWVEAREADDASAARWSAADR